MIEQNQESFFLEVTRIARVREKNRENKPTASIASSRLEHHIAPRKWSGKGCQLLRFRDGGHPMLFAGYQTNPNYLGIYWAFF